MKEYVEIGQEQMGDFYKSWEENFKLDEEEALGKI